MSGIVYWVWLSSLKSISGRLRRALYEHYGDVKDIFAAEERELRSLGASDEEVRQIMLHDISRAEHIISRCQEENVRILTLQDAEYPERLRNIPDAPYVLYIKGRLPAIDCEAAIAVVGTRKTSPYGDKMSRDIAYGIAKSGGMVVTGLASGADSCAAQGALMGGGTVVGVLGTAINEVFPKYNEPLFNDVAAVGALVSEYPPDEKGSARYFPERNRIIAGLSLGVVVTEAPAASGALITARWAADYGRDVFAVPGNVDAPNSRGSNSLLKDGALLVENAWDVMSLYQYQFPNKISRSGRLRVPETMAVPEKPEEKPKQSKAEGAKGFFKLRLPIRKKKTETSGESKLETQISGLSEKQLKIISVMDRPSMHIDDIIELSQLPAATVLSEMTLLQIKGYVAQESGKCFTLKIIKRG